MLNLLEILSVAAVLLYIYFAAKQVPIGWIFGIVASVASMVFFIQSALYASAALNGIYAIQGIIGFFNWTLFNPQKKVVISNGYLRHVVAIVIVCVVSSILYSFKELQLNFLDIVLGCLSIHATNLEIKKDISCWYYWIIANVGYAVFYVTQTDKPMYLYAVLMLFLAVYSYIAKQKWMALKTND